MRNGRIFARLVPDGGARREGKGRWFETGSVCGHKLARPVSSVSLRTNLTEFSVFNFVLKLLLILKIMNYLLT